jgi:hypothetical protein
MRKTYKVIALDGAVLPGDNAQQLEARLNGELQYEGWEHHFNVNIGHVALVVFRKTEMPEDERL